MRTTPAYVPATDLQRDRPDPPGRDAQAQPEALRGRPPTAHQIGDEFADQRRELRAVTRARRAHHDRPDPVEDEVLGRRVGVQAGRLAARRRVEPGQPALDVSDDPLPRPPGRRRRPGRRRSVIRRRRARRSCGRRPGRRRGRPPGGRRPRPGSWITLGHGGAVGSSRGKWKTCCWVTRSGGSATSTDQQGPTQPPAATTTASAVTLVRRPASPRPSGEHGRRGARGRTSAPAAAASASMRLHCARGVHRAGLRVVHHVTLEAHPGPARLRPRAAGSTSCGTPASARCAATARHVAARRRSPARRACAAASSPDAAPSRATARTRARSAGMYSPSP